MPIRYAPLILTRDIEIIESEIRYEAPKEIFRKLRQDPEFYRKDIFDRLKMSQSKMREFYSVYRVRNSFPFRPILPNIFREVEERIWSPRYYDFRPYVNIYYLEE